MGLFGGKKKETNVSSQPGAHHVDAIDIADENLPVAVPVEATVVVGSHEAHGPPKGTVTTTTVYPPNSKLAGSSVQLPQSETFVTTIPPPPGYKNTSNLLGRTTVYRRGPVCMVPTCPSCHQAGIRTRVRTHPHCATWIACIVLLVVFWPICWIPFVCDVFKQTDHYCGSCGTKVAEVTPFSDCCETRRG